MLPQACHQRFVAQHLAHLAQQHLPDHRTRRMNLFPLRHMDELRSQPVEHIRQIGSHRRAHLGRQPLRSVMPGQHARIYRCVHHFPPCPEPDVPSSCRSFE